MSIQTRIAAVLDRELSTVNRHCPGFIRSNGEIADVLVAELAPDIDKVAEAIWRADINNGHRDFIAEADVSWADDIGKEAKDHYRRMARAAVTAWEPTE